MNLNQIKNAILLSEIQNFSQTAKQLNISQPSLSKQILNLEKELGITIFDREHTPLTLTPAGEYFIRTAKELIYKEEQLKKSLHRFSMGENGCLYIGITPFRSLYMMPNIVNKIKERYPGVKVVLNEANSNTLRKEAADGKYDLAIVNIPVDTSVLDVITLEPDELVLAVPNKMLSLLPKELEANSSSIDFSVAKDLPFIVLGATQELRQLFDKLCTFSDFHPNITCEVVGITTAWSMVRAGVGATLLPLQFVKNQYLDDNFTLFRIDNPFTPRQPAIVTRKGQYISDYAKYAIELLREMS